MGKTDLEIFRNAAPGERQDAEPAGPPCPQHPGAAQSQRPCPCVPVLSCSHGHGQHIHPSSTGGCNGPGDPAVALGIQLWPWAPSCAHVAVQPHPGWSQPPAVLPVPDKVSSPSGKMTQTLPICSGKTCWAGESRIWRVHGGLAEGAGSCLYPAFPACPRPPDPPGAWENPTCRCQIHPAWLLQHEILSEVSPRKSSPGGQGGVPIPRWGP